MRFLIKIEDIIYNFWNSHPALYYGLFFLIGSSSVFLDKAVLIFLILALLLPFLSQLFRGNIHVLKPILLSLSIFLILVVYSSSFSSFHDEMNGPLEGKALIQIESLSTQSNHFGNRIIYRCKIKQFFPQDLKDQNLKIKGIRCSIFFPMKNNIYRPLANRDYLITGFLSRNANGKWLFKVDKKEDWLVVEGSWNSSEWRFQLKQWANEKIKSYFSYSQSGLFLSGLLTGEFNDPVLKDEFARFGLQHIMAISGFHFAIISGLLNFLLRLLNFKTSRIPLLIGLLSLYFLFLGLSSSVLRAWVMIVIGLIGQSINRQGVALNSLGAALIAVIVIDPLLIETIGFQFSFLTTAGILLLFRPFDFLLEQLLEKRSLSQMIEMNKLNQHGYCLLTFFRQSLALSFSVNLVIWPLIFYHFEKFPLLSLFYNFFIPFFVSLSMFFLLAGLLGSLLLPPIGYLIHYLNDHYTQWMLNLIYHMPSSVDVYYTANSPPLHFIILYLTILIILSIVSLHFIKEKQIEKKNLLFI